MSEPPISCEQCRIGISSRLDDEDPGCPSVALHAHLAGCAACRAFESEATRLHRVSRVTAAPAVPDLTPRVLAAIGEPSGRSEPAGPTPVSPSTRPATSARSTPRSAWASSSSPGSPAGCQA